jgi:O-antigen/teichoic acid export membrane protein
MPDGDSPGGLPVLSHGRSAVILIGGTFGLQALIMASGILTARLFGIEGRGIVALVFALGLISSQLTLGGSLPNALAKNLAERGLAARDGLRSIARRRFPLILVPCLVSGGFMLVLQRAEPGHEKYALGACVFVMSLVTILFRILTGSLQGEVGRLSRMVGVAMIPQFLFTVALAVAFASGWRWDAIDGLIAFLAASFLGLAIGFMALAKPTRRVDDRLDERELWGETRRTYVSSVRPIDGLGLDRILIGTLMGNAPLGLYSAAIAIANLCGIVGSAVSIIVLPQVAQRHADPASQWAVIRRWLLLTAGIAAVVVISLEAVVAPAIRIAFGEEFTGATECARWLIVADGMLGLRKVMIAALQGMGRGGFASWIEFLLMPVMVLGVVMAAHFDYLPGIGITMVVVSALSCSVLGLAVRRSLRAAPASMDVGDHGRPAL